jgi:sterol desaturase/sphingolipid hydroxylase (fatty acid hydroxylase superfamily)
MFDTIMSYLLYPLSYLMLPSSQYFMPTYFAAAAFGIVVLMVMKRRLLGIRQIKLLLWPARLVQHASTRLDAKLFFIGAYYLLLQALFVGGLTVLSVDGAVAVLDRIAGFRPAPLAPSWLVTGTTMLLVFLAVEFGYWFSHFLMHRIPALWEFHKVHHSAQVLTPATEWRQHPVELAMFPVLIGIVSSLVQGPMIWAFGASAQVVDPVKANLISMAFWYTTVHLRHTELPIYVGNFLAKLIQTPSHHQVHHSIDPKHFDKNMGYCLSIFDWLFGTLYIPSRDEKLTYGLGHEDTALETAVGSIVAPFGRAFAIVVKPVKIWFGGKAKSEEAASPQG